MTDDKKTEGEQMNRRSLIALASFISLAAWHKPIINSIVLPAHAQTSCSSSQDVDVTGEWLFTDPDGKTVEINFLDDSSLIIDNRVSPQPWRRSTVDDTLILEVRGTRAPWRAFISGESNCVASEITITRADSDGPSEITNSPFTVPLIGIRN